MEPLKLDVGKNERVFGYVRVSTKEQKEDRQIDVMHGLGIPDDHIFLDKQSGEDFDRPGFIAMMGTLRKDDLLCIHSIDRLGRDYMEIQEQWRCITRDKGADIYVVDMPLLDTRQGKDLMGRFVSELVLQVLSFVAENEKNAIHARQAQGIAAAKARGVQFGRPSIAVPSNFMEICLAYEEGNISLEEATEMTKMSRSTFFRKKKHAKTKMCK